VDRIFSITFDFLAEALKGRHALQLEMGAEATRILSGKPNSIKLAESASQIRAILLDWNQPEEKVLAELKGVFQDIVLHPIGLIGGFKEGIRGLLRELSPVSFEQKAKASPFRLWPVSLPFPPFSVGSAWRFYKMRHHQLSTEEVRTFEKIWGTYIAQGYLDVLQQHKTR
jgi:predicted component of type VI protein secretion system